MWSTRPVRGLAAAAVLMLGLLTTLAMPTRAYAHCDTLDGPVVVAAQKALEAGELELMLIWVREQDEPEIRHAFEHVRRVRALGGDAASLADRFFLEMVVRTHREGEGEPYTGLKPAGTDLGHAVPAADRALESGSVDELRAVLHRMIDTRLDTYFAEAQRRQEFAPADVAVGRDYVAPYVRLMHFAEMLEAIAAGDAHPDHAPAASAGHPGHVH